jgi:type IV secretory pathway VirJ component
MNSITTLLLLAAVRLLPLVERPAPGTASAQPYFAILLTGDGGWRAVDSGLTRELNRNGVSVVGLLSDDYFATARTPDGIARDVGQLIETYGARWHRQQVLLIGYSRGADALPVALVHLPPALRQRVVLAAMLAPSSSMELEIVPWWKLGASAPSIALAPLVRSIHDVRLMCVHGEDEDDTLCDALPNGAAVDVKTPGGHHFDRDYDELARIILRAVRSGAS